MKLFSISTLFIFVMCLSAFTACKKEGTGGKATITGHVKHHETHIPNAVVYIKYDATELPGTDASDYDDQTTASSGDGHYEFNNLNKGNYYLYSTGYDSTISEPVSGGIPAQIEEHSETLEIDLPVTE